MKFFTWTTVIIAVCNGALVTGACTNNCCDWDCGQCTNNCCDWDCGQLFGIPCTGCSKQHCGETCIPCTGCSKEHCGETCVPPPPPPLLQTPDPTPPPTPEPMPDPTPEPTRTPTKDPTPEPNPPPEPEPNPPPEPKPDPPPAPDPTPNPTPEPSASPTSEPSAQPTVVADRVEPPTQQTTTVSPPVDASSTQTNATSTSSSATTNDVCDGAEGALVPGTTVAGSTLGATPDAIPICGTSTAGTYPGVWYTVQGTGSMLMVSTCTNTELDSGYENQLSIWQGSCSSLQCVAGNSDPSCDGSSVSWLTVSGQMYYVLVHGMTATPGTFGIQVVTDGSGRDDDSGVEDTHTSHSVWLSLGTFGFVLV